MVDERHDEKEVVEEAEPKKKKPLVLIIVAVLVVVLLAGGGAAGYFFLVKGKHSGGAEVKKGEAKTEAAAKGEIKESGPIEALEPFVVNLSDTENTRYLKAVMQLELESPELKAEIEKRMPEIRDEIIMLLSSKSFDDLSTSPGKRSLKRSILESVNKYLTTGKVTNVFFSDFVIQ
jgi:flagellar protein FliL